MPCKIRTINFQKQVFFSPFAQSALFFRTLFFSMLCSVCRSNEAHTNTLITHQWIGSIEITCLCWNWYDQKRRISRAHKIYTPTVEWFIETDFIESEIIIYSAIAKIQNTEPHEKKTRIVRFCNRFNVSNNAILYKFRFINAKKEEGKKPKFIRLIRILNVVINKYVMWNICEEGKRRSERIDDT